MRPTVISSDQDQFQLLQEMISIDRKLYTVKSCKKGDYIYLPDERSDKVFFLKKGRITTGTFSDEGKIMAKGMVLAGSFFGELGLIGEELRDDFSIAKDESEVWIFSITDLRRILKNRPNLYMYLIGSVGHRLMKAEKRLESMVFKNSRTRIVEFLHSLGEEQGQRIGYETLVRNFFTHQEIADLTGTSRQTVTTTLNELRNQNIITFNRRRLLIRDLSDLYKAAC